MNIRIKKILALAAVASCAGASSLFAVTPTPTPTATPTPTPTPHAINLTDVQVYKAGTNLPAVLRAIDDGHGAYVPAFILVDTNGDPASLGGGSGGTVAIDQTTPGTTNAVAVTGAQYTVAITVATTGATIAAGKHHIEFILSSDFAGTIAGAAISGASLGVYDPGVLPVGSTFAALIYTIGAGSATITTW